MLNSVPKNQKIFQIDYGSDSQQDNHEQKISNIKKVLPKQNPQKDNTSPFKKQSNIFKVQKQQNAQYSSQVSQRTRVQPLRRNKSFKVKKCQQQTPRIKPDFNKSVSKFTNIFNEAQEIQLRSSNKLAVHEQTNKDQSLNQMTTVKSSFLKSSQLNVIKKAQQPSILKLSNFSKPENKKKDSNTKTVRFMVDFEQKQKLMRKSAYIQKPINQLIQRKLSQRVQPRPQTKGTTRKQVKVRIKGQQITDMQSFTQKKIGSAYVLVANLKKDTSGFNWLWPQFHMHQQKSNAHILSAKKKAANTTSNYYISRNQKEIDVQNDKYMGKVRSNFVGSCFNIFNKGINPQNIEKNTQNKDNVRHLLASVIYESQIANANPKTLRVYMVKHPYNYYDLEGTDVNQQQRNLQQLYQIGQNKHKIHLFRNRKPVYNKKQNRFVLNFDGRIKQPSTKNFILQDAQSKKQALMFGKIKDQQYILYISSPLTPHIGLGIALAQLDSKIICD